MPTSAADAPGLGRAHRAATRSAVDALCNGGTLVTVGVTRDGMMLPLAHLPLRAVMLGRPHVWALEERRALIAPARAGQAPTIPIEARPLDTADVARDDPRQGRVVGRVVLRP
jgi:D-arabinose 1-dehydrogenase-like Zn-dependent alcohol dehydrogenase